MFNLDAVCLYVVTIMSSIICSMSILGMCISSINSSRNKDILGLLKKEQ